jgi:hypothetical protein
MIGRDEESGVVMAEVGVLVRLHARVRRGQVAELAPDLREDLLVHLPDRVVVEAILGSGSGVLVPLIVNPSEVKEEERGLGDRGGQAERRGRIAGLQAPHQALALRGHLHVLGRLSLVVRDVVELAFEGRPVRGVGAVAQSRHMPLADDPHHIVLGQGGDPGTDPLKQGGGEGRRSNSPLVFGSMSRTPVRSIVCPGTVQVAALFRKALPVFSASLASGA